MKLLQTTTTQPQPTTTTDSDSGSFADKAVDAAQDAAGSAVDVGTKPVRDVAGVGFDQLNQAGSEMAGTTFGDLAASTLNFSDPEGIVLGPFTWSIQVLAGFVGFATIALVAAALMFSPRRKLGARLGYLSEAVVKYLIISAVGVTIGVFLVEGSGDLTTTAVETSLPSDINTDGANVWSSALAVVVVPIVGVAFEFQRFFVGILIAFWPLAAAISMSKAYKHALPICSALLVANVIWPPISALFIGNAFAALPNVAKASWLCVGAVGFAIVFNVLSLAARSTS